MASERFKVQLYTNTKWGVWDADGTVAGMLCGAWAKGEDGKDFSSDDYQAAQGWANFLSDVTLTSTGMSGNMAVQDLRNSINEL